MTPEAIERLAHRIDRLTSPKTRGFWMVALVLMLAGGAWGSWRVSSLVREARRERETSDRLLTLSVALRTNLDRARARADTSEARLALTLGEMAAVRDTARQERARARTAGAALRSRVEAAAGDSAAVVALVDSIQVEHEAEVRADSVELAAADSTSAARAVRIATLEGFVVSLEAALANADSTITSVTLQRDLFERAAERAQNPGLFVTFTRGAKWFAAGAVLGFVVAQ